VLVPAGFAILLLGGVTGMIGEGQCPLPGRSAGRRAHDLKLDNKFHRGRGPADAPAVAVKAPRHEKHRQIPIEPAAPSVLDPRDFAPCRFLDAGLDCECSS
jgi:hypothetical protein